MSRSAAQFEPTELRDPTCGLRGCPIEAAGQPCAVLDEGVVPAVNARGPVEDPRACSNCGVHTGRGDDDHSEGCARKLGITPPERRCEHRGTRGPEEQTNAIDASGDGE